MKKGKKGGRPGAGFGGFKAPGKADMIDKLLLGEAEEDDDDRNGNNRDSESLIDDGRPAQLEQHVSRLTEPMSGRGKGQQKMPVLRSV